MQRVHVIGVGGSVMHALASYLRKTGYQVTGSDNRIEDPARTRLMEAGLLPDKEGWFPERITPDIDLIILGMHAREDNPELRRAQELRLPILDMPSFTARAAQHKHRIVVAGSHGKTTTTALLIYAFQQLGISTDWLIGALTPSLPTTFQLSDAPTFIFEGDEYPASVLNPQPKAAVYHPHWLILTGIAWDHVNIYPTPERYLSAFEHILQNLPKGGICFYNSADPSAKMLVEKILRPGWQTAIPYQGLPYIRKEGRWFVRLGQRIVPLRFWGRHNVLNVSAVWRLLQEFFVEDKDFAEILSSFELPFQRQTIWHQSADRVVVRDFAHAPSKVQAAVEAIRETFPKLPLIVVLELHTYSSLKPTYAVQYQKVLRSLRNVWIYLNEQIAWEKGADPQALRMALGKGIRWFHNREDLAAALREALTQGPCAILLLSSGNFGGLTPQEIGLSQ
ncbi:MAG: Mur ligase family protein [Bacteroidia bacterium]|nr:Mur ligase family protein [Bacteroidia bacterium]MCX7652484.1 Mur ligase family protein [Bacteroidia bacterium]MDW8416693.1 Mur ligase family protein [Bacteroidia bacterium]